MMLVIVLLVGGTVCVCVLQVVVCIVYVCECVLQHISQS